MTNDFAQINSFNEIFYEKQLNTPFAKLYLFLCKEGEYMNRYVHSIYGLFQASLLATVDQKRFFFLSLFFWGRGWGELGAVCLDSIYPENSRND